MARFRLFAIVGVLVASMVFTFPVSASAWTTGSGTGTIAPVLVKDLGSIGPILIQERDLAGTISGDLSGTYTEHVRGLIYPSGFVAYRGTMTFSGTVTGCGSGEVTLDVSGIAKTGAPLSVAIIQVSDSGTNTIGVTGAGLVYQVGSDLTYQVSYQCE